MHILEYAYLDVRLNRYLGSSFSFFLHYGKQATKIRWQSSSNWNVAKTRARFICFGSMLFTRPAIVVWHVRQFSFHICTNVCMRIGHYRMTLKSKTIERVSILFFFFFHLVWVVASFFFLLISKNYWMTSKNYFRFVRFQNMLKEYINCDIVLTIFVFVFNRIKIFFFLFS